MYTNREILAKADLVLQDLIDDGGILQPAQAQKFIRLLIDESVLLQHAQTKPMAAQKHLLEKARFGSRILRAGTEGAALPTADRSKPNLGRVELDAKLFKAEVNLTNEDLQDSIERGGLRQTIMEMMGEAIARDIEEVVVRGDTTSADPFLASFNGILKAATSNVHDALSAPLTKGVLKAMLKLMPSPFVRNRKLLRYFTSIDGRTDYADTLANRQTQMGDGVLVDGEVPTYSGAPVIDIPLFPEAPTQVILTDPKNICVGIWREIMMETDKLVREGVIVIVATLRMDFKYVEETASVKAINVATT